MSLKTSKKDLHLKLEADLYKLDFSYRLDPTQNNLDKIENHLKLYPKEALLRLKAKNFPNLCIGTKALASKQNRKIIAQEVKDLAQRDKLDL